MDLPTCSFDEYWSICTVLKTHFLQSISSLRSDKFLYIYLYLCHHFLHKLNFKKRNNNFIRNRVCVFRSQSKYLKKIFLYVDTVLTFFIVGSRHNRGGLQILTNVFVNKYIHLPENPAAERVSQNIFPLQLFLFRLLKSL